MSARRVLVLAPHTDDGEFGCGATIAKFVEGGDDVFYVAFSTCEESVPSDMERDILSKEVRAATEVLGIPGHHLMLRNYRVRYFPEHRQEILQDMINMSRDINPDIVFLPSINDTHQDHRQIAHEGFRAFKRRTMLGYEVPWNNLQFATVAFAVIEERHLARKIEAMKCYQSQARRSYANEEFLRSLAVTRGTQIGQRYAETFDVFRMLLT
jgi:LmbE family N-acetylglucosaminyl deacetylase